MFSLFKLAGLPLLGLVLGSRRLQNTQAGTKRHYEYHYGAGETTFEHQLDAFVKMIRDGTLA